MCACGCGLPAPIAHQTDTKRGYVKGQPRTYRHGHAARGRMHSEESRRKRARFGSEHHAWKGDEASYSAIHIWVRAHFEKTDRCEECGAPGTEWANVSGEYRRERGDWLELCRSCHVKRDGLVENLRRSSDDAA